MLMWPGKSSKWIIARKKHHFLTMKYDDGSSSSSRSEISLCRRRCCFATVSLSIQRSSLWMMGQILDSRQNHVTKLQRFPLSPNDFIYDAMTWPHWTILGGSICWSFRPKKALGWKLQDIETHDITGKKNIAAQSSSSIEVLGNPIQVDFINLISCNVPPVMAEIGKCTGSSSGARWRQLEEIVVFMNSARARVGAYSKLVPF